MPVCMNECIHESNIVRERGRGERTYGENTAKLSRPHHPCISNYCCLDIVGVVPQKLLCVDIVIRVKLSKYIESKGGTGRTSVYCARTSLIRSSRGRFRRLCERGVGWYYQMKHNSYKRSDIAPQGAYIKLKRPMNSGRRSIPTPCCV